MKNRKATQRQRARLRKLKAFDQQFLQQGLKIAGVDEVGRGPLAGPVVACALVLRDTRFRVAIDDSKCLTPESRRAAFEQILPCSEIGIGVVYPLEIDGANIFQASLKAMRHAVEGLPTLPQHLLVDGPWKIPQTQLPMTPIIEGDSKSLSIACASIVAKVVRDSLMEWYDGRYPGYGFAKHKGYATAAHVKCLELLGPSPIHRMTFAPVALVADETEFD